MCAAIAAARHGARTALIHSRHVFGGNASSEIRMHVCGASENLQKPDLEEGGILYEMMLENKSRNDYFNFSIWDMVLFSVIKKQENLTVYLNTVMEDCEMDENTIRSITAYQHTTETRWHIDGNDCYIPNIRNHDDLDLARTAVITASSAKDGFSAEQVISGVSRSEGGLKNIWVSEGISESGETLFLKLKEKSKVSQVRITFDSNFNYAIKLTLSGKRQKQQRIGTPPELVKEYTVTLWDDERKVREKTVTDNVQRLNVVDFEPVICNKITITIHSTNGNENARVYEVRVYA